MLQNHATMADAPTRQPRAALDLSSRNRKALKIERLLELAQRRQPIDMLEIGTGFPFAL